MSEPGEEVNRLAYAVIGAAIEVHQALGPGFLEASYEQAMAVELAIRGIPFARQVAVDLAYKERRSGRRGSISWSEGSSFSS